LIALQDKKSFTGSNVSVTIKPSPHVANEFRPIGASVPTARDLTGLLKDKDKTKDGDKPGTEAEAEVEIKGDGIIQSSFENRFPSRSSQML
jgi:hypothetical protein